MAQTQPVTFKFVVWRQFVSVINFLKFLPVLHNICRFTLQMRATAGTGSSWSPDSKTQSKFPTWVAWTQSRRPSPVASQGAHWQEYGIISRGRTQTQISWYGGPSIVLTAVPVPASVISFQFKARGRQFLRWFLVTLASTVLQWKLALVTHCHLAKILLKLVDRKVLDSVPYPPTSFSDLMEPFLFQNIFREACGMRHGDFQLAANMEQAVISNSLQRTESSVV